MRTTRRAACLLLPVSCLLLMAADPLHESAESTVRAANAAFKNKDTDAAEKLYAAAEEKTADPGLVAFNKATLLFQKEDFRDAEGHYRRAIEDKACPADRAAKAWFNRGTCLVRRGGSAGVYRSAVACFEKCLDLDQTEPSPALVRENLELAKLLWADANKKEAKPKNPNEPVEEDFQNQPPQPPAAEQGGSSDQTGKNETATQPKIEQVPNAAAAGNAKQTDVPQAGKQTNLPQLNDTDTMQPLTADDTREYLRRAEARIRKDRQAMLGTLYGPDRPGVKDW